MVCRLPRSPSRGTLGGDGGESAAIAVRVIYCQPKTVNVAWPGLSAGPFFNPQSSCKSTVVHGGNRALHGLLKGIPKGGVFFCEREPGVHNEPDWAVQWFGATGAVRANVSRRPFELSRWRGGRFACVKGRLTSLLKFALLRTSNQV
jgi:hypothetical protein